MPREDRPRTWDVGFFQLLGLMFIGFRLAGVIDWPWWQVLSPLWGGAALWLIAALALALAKK